MGGTACKKELYSQSSASTGLRGRDARLDTPQLPVIKSLTPCAAPITVAAITVDRQKCLRKQTAREIRPIREIWERRRWQT